MEEGASGTFSPLANMAFPQPDDTSRKCRNTRFLDAKYRLQYWHAIPSFCCAIISSLLNGGSLLISDASFLPMVQVFMPSSKRMPMAVRPFMISSESLYRRKDRTLVRSSIFRSTNSTDMPLFMSSLSPSASFSGSTNR